MDIIQEFKTFTGAFANFKNSVTYKISQAEKILGNRQQYYVGRRRAQEMRIENLEGCNFANDMDTDGSNPDDEEIEPIQELNNCYSEECSQIELKNYSSGLQAQTLQIILENFVDDIDNSGFRKGYKMRAEYDNICSLKNISSVVKRTLRKLPGSEVNYSDLKIWPFRGESAEISQSNRLSPKEVESSYSEILSSSDTHVTDENNLGMFPKIANTETVIRLLEDSINSKQDSEVSNCDEKSAEIIPEIINPTLYQVSKRFTLNERQGVAFRIAGSYLLDALKRTLLQHPPGNPLRMHLSGEGGTGKSRVVDALRFLAKGWGSPDSIVTVAPTGIAAVLVNGETVHSKLQMFQHKRPTMEQLEQWSKVHMLIWDEISMTGQSLFAKAMKKIKAFLGTEPGDDPRIHIVTAGDFAQLLLASKSLFSPLLQQLNGMRMVLLKLNQTNVDVLLKSLI